MSLPRFALLASILAFALTACAAPPPCRELPGRVTPGITLTPLLPEGDPAYRVQRAAARPALDGRTDEWKDVPAMVLDKKEQSRGPWAGPSDYSGALRVLWDDEGMYFCLQVTESSHRAPNGIEDFWQNDCSQFAFDPYRCGPKGSFNRDMLSCAVGDSPIGPMLVSYRRPGSATEGPLLTRCKVRMTVRNDGVRVFQWAMPWTMLDPVNPWLLGECGFNWTLNHNGGTGFNGALFWTKGLLWGQDASQFGRLIFDGAPGPVAMPAAACCGAGRRAAMLGLRPECKIPGAEPEKGSWWMSVSGVAPWSAARLVVRSLKPGPIEATATIYPAGQDRPVAQGKLSYDGPAAQPAAFAWDVSGLPDGRYDLVYHATGMSPEFSRRLEFYQVNLDTPQAIRARKDALRTMFALDRPAWADFSNAPALVRKHRGLAAVMLQLMEEKEAGRWRAAISDSVMREEQMKALACGAEMVRAVARGEDFLGAQRGAFWSAYYSEADGSGQSFVVILPPDFDAGKTYPMIVNLHGYGTGGESPSAAGEHGARTYIEVLPWGRGNSQYVGLGERDVLDVIAWMREWYKIDPARVYLMGFSMGGGGTWQMAGRYGDLFAAAAPDAGYAIGQPLENLRNVPVFNLHGDEDLNVPIDISRCAVSRLHQLGYAVLYKEAAGGGHGSSVANQNAIRDWLIQLRRPDRPAAVTFTCLDSNPPANRAYWLTVRRLADPHVPASVEARVTGRGPLQSLSLGLAGIAAVELDVASMPLDPRSGLLVQAGMNFMERKAPLPDKLFVVRTENGWSLADSWSPPEENARPYRPGAASNLYSGEPMMIVAGTQGAPGRVRLLRETAERISHDAGSWFGETMPEGQFPIVCDKDLTAEEIAHCNLILVGGPNENSFTARILPRLPIAIDSKNQLHSGDRTPVSLAGAGFFLCYYNPLAPQRLIYLIAAGEAGPASEKWYSRKPPRLLMGTQIDRPADVPDLFVQSFTGVARRQMQFTVGWQWRARPGADRPAPADRAGPKSFAEAELRVILQTTGADFAVGGLPEAGAPDVYDPNTFTLADLAIESSPGQTLLGSVTGKELIEIQERLAAKGELLILPAVDAKRIAPEKLYRLAMGPWTAWALGQNRKKNLRDAAAGPDWRMEDLWRLLFPQEAQTSRNAAVP